MNAAEDIEARVAGALRHVAGLPMGTVEAPPGMSALRSRRPRRSPARRRAVTVSTVAAVFVMAGTLIALRASDRHTVSVNGAPSGPAGLEVPVSLPKIVAPAGATPLDYGLLRLYLPLGWMSVNECRATGAVPGSSTEIVADTFLLIPSSEGQSCSEPSKGGWVTVQPMAGALPTGLTATSVNGTKVWSPPGEADRRETLYVPSLHVVLTAEGAGRGILATLGPSTLDAVVSQRRATPVPTSWKAVRFDGLQVKVPPRWPVQVITSQVAQPGSCSGQIFRAPTVDLGDNGFRPLCLFGFGQLAPPVDGLWIGSPAPSQSGTDAHEIAFGALPTVLTYSDTNSEAIVGVQVTVGAGTVDLGVGLGENPAIAEEILSSLQLTALPSSTATPTTGGQSTESTVGTTIVLVPTT